MSLFGRNTREVVEAAFDVYRAWARSDDPYSGCEPEIMAQMTALFHALDDYDMNRVRWYVFEQEGGLNGR